jgi:uncharacterized membrane protein YfcA
MAWDLSHILLELLIGAVVGASIGLTGVGGGVLILPALTILLGMPATTAVGTASAYAFLTKLHAGFEHARLRTIDFPMAHLFLIGAVPGTCAACLLIGHWKAQAAGPSALLALQGRLELTIEVLLAFAALLMLGNLLRRQGAEEPPPRRPLGPGRRALGIVAGVVVGADIGATSVGGGVVVVPLLIICFGLTARATVGTSIYIALALTLITAVLSAGRGDVDWLVTGVLVAGSTAGVSAGSRLAGRLPERPLQYLVLTLMTVAIAAMALK